MGSDPISVEERERLFHNEWAKSIDVDELCVREAFESPTAIENQYALSLMGDIHGKKKNYVEIELSLHGIINETNFFFRFESELFRIKTRF
jgi:hypothetical protein